MSDNIIPFGSGAIGAHLKESGAAEQPPGGGELDENCPVVPLGFSPEGGGVCHYLNAIGQYVTVPAKQHSKLTLYGLFGARRGFLIGPREWAKGWDENTKRPKDFAPDKVAASLIGACQNEGPFDTSDRIRGRGTWIGEDDDLVVHLGPQILAGGQVQRPGKRGRFIYTVQPPRPGPAREPQPGGEEGPAAELERWLKLWTYRRPDIDARLLLGWMCASSYCGALDWRPTLWVTGFRGSGKSTLIRMLGKVLAAGEGCHVTADATAAGLRSKLSHDALPVLFDDQEPTEGSDKLNKVIEEMVRLAASGGSVLRGTADHGSASFTVRFMALFNSILKPTLKSQDASRISFITILPSTGRAPMLPEDQLRILGKRLFRRMLDRWPAFREALALWRDALLRHGIDPRGADQYGTMLAAADIALNDSLPDTDTLDELAAAIAAGTKSERFEDQPEWARCLEHIRTSLAPQWRGGDLRNIGQLVAVAAQRPVILDPENGALIRSTAGQAEDAQKALATMGLRVIPLLDDRKRPLRVVVDVEGKPVPGEEPHHQGRGDMLGHLAVANSHAALNGMVFRGVHWQSRSGTAGGWKAALEDAPGAMVGREMRFGGPASRCVLVPLGLVLDAGGGDADPT